MAKLVVIAFCLSDRDNMWFLNEAGRISMIPRTIDKVTEIIKLFRERGVPFLMREYDIGALAHGNEANFNKDIVNQLRTIARIDMQNSGKCKEPSVMSFIIPDKEITTPTKEITG